MPNMIESIMGLVGPQIINGLATRVGESESAVKSGLQSSAVTLLGSLASKSGDSSLMSQVLGMVTGSGASGILSNLSSFATSGPSGSVAEMGTKLIGMLLGNNQSTAIDAIAKAAGIRSTSAGSLLSMAAPLLMGFLGKRASEGNLNAASFGNMLGAELPALKSMLPAGLGSIVTGLGTAMAAGAGAAGSTVSSAYRVGSSAVGNAAGAAADAGSSSTRWLMPLLLGLVALGGIYWFMNRGTGVPDVTGAAKDAASTAGDAAKSAAANVGDAAKSAIAALGEFFKRKLPNGVELNIPQLGVENKLIGFIEDASKPIDKTTWFNFDRLLFDTGRATLQASSQEQLANIAQVMKAYPKVNIKLGGYTDNVGDKSANIKLSTDRANSVMAELVKLGVAANRLSAEGYGDQHPVASNDTAEGRAQNRRIAMRVTAK